MKHGWLMLTGVCAVVSGIVLFCVVAGGYTSLLRAKNRINTAKSLLAQECIKRSGLVRDLVAMAAPVLSPEVFNTLKKQDALAMSILNEADQIKVPLSPGQVNEIEASQHQLSRQIFFVIGEMEQVQSIKDANSFRDLSRAIKDQTQIVIYTTKRYNKEAVYFNTRKQVFPGFLVARWFGLDQMTFPQIPVRIFEFEEPPSKDGSLS